MRKRYAPSAGYSNLVSKEVVRHFILSYVISRSPIRLQPSAFLNLEF